MKNVLAYRVMIKEKKMTNLELIENFIEETGGVEEVDYSPYLMIRKHTVAEFGMDSSMGLFDGNFINHFQQDYYYSNENN
tara:strand:+ start:144 stop:383 length:240 start_codon:yes stop_codon:yes gene_type:complete